LAAGANLLAAATAIFGWLAYVIIYGLAKRGTEHSTTIGSVSGAVTPVVGYVAAAGRLDAAALILFLILATWQMPHFYAIATFRSGDYAAAGLPVLPVKRGAPAARRHIIGFIVAFMLATIALAAAGYAGYTYLSIVVIMSVTWLYTGLKGFSAADPAPWARRVFGFSLITLMVTCVAISLAAVLP
jgi:protoheme IX farnesyltransferase